MGNKKNLTPAQTRALQTLTRKQSIAQDPEIGFRAVDLATTLPVMRALEEAGHARKVWRSYDRERGLHSAYYWLPVG